MVHQITSLNPATEAVLAQIPFTDAAQIPAMVERARQAQQGWAKRTFAERAQYLLAFRDLVLKKMDALALLISQENGKPIQEALGNDIIPVLDLVTHFAKKSEKILKREKIRLGKWAFLGRRSHLEFYPWGVVGVISPWNFPFSTPVGEIAMALMVGNAVIFKPSEFTTLTGLEIQKLFEEVGLPPNVLQIVCGDGRIGTALVGSAVDKVSFTGSVATGKKIMGACAQDLKPVTLELGGKDPFVVFEDADLDVASSAAVWGAFCNSGQICASVERVYVQEAIAEPFLQKVLEKTKQIRQGSGQSPDVDMAAMTAKMQRDKVIEHVEDARKRGAKILTGGHVIGDKGFFYAPTVLTNVDHSFPIVREETFGPVLPIMTFATEAEVIAKSNDSPYALNAYLWTKDRARAQRVASQIVAGTVNINESVFSHALPQAPWGGPKASGIGHIHGALGLLDLVAVRHVHENRKPFKRNFFWWYGYSDEKIVLLKTLAQALFGKGWGRVAAFFKFVKLSLKAKVR